MRLNISILFYGIVIISALMLFSCKQQTNESISKYQLKLVEAKEYVVPKDSVAEPRTLPFEKPIKVPAIERKLVALPTNVHLIGSPKIIKYGVPTIFTPGQDGFSIPKTVPAIDRTVVAGLPMVVSAKEVNAIDPNPHNFSSFNQLIGLKNKNVRSIYEDKKGNLWFGTEGGGVSKYDGQNFTTFTQTQGLGNNDITSIVEDHYGNMWFGTWGGGISKYDGKTFTNFTIKEGLSSDHVNNILTDRMGNLWIGSWGGGASKYDGKSFIHYTDKEGLGTNNVSHILEDKNGNLWFGTDGNGISKYDGKSFHNFTSKEGLYLDVITHIAEDKNGNIWFGTQSGGMAKYDGKSFTNFGEKDGLPNDFIFSIEEDKNGNLWISTWKGGVTLYDGQSFINYPVLDGLQNNSVESIFEDKSGNLWFGSWGGGIAKYSPQKFKHFTNEDGLTNNDIQVITEDKNGNLWIGTYGGGVLKYDRKSFTQITEKFPGYGVLATCILEDSSGNIWFGSWANGVTMFDGEFFTHFTEMKEMDRCRIMSMLEDKNGNLWFGTDFGGVTKYDGHRFTQFTIEEGLSNNMVTSMVEDENGSLWFGTMGGGATKYDGVNFTHYGTKGGLSDNNILSIIKDKNDNLWFGTDGGGVSKYDGAFFTQFTKEEGLGSNRVTSIFEDKNGDLWFGTDSGLSKLRSAILDEIQDEAMLGAIYENNVLFSNYSYEDGFLGLGVNTGKTIYQDKNDAIWVGTGDRLTVFKPEELGIDTIAPSLQLTNLALFNENILWSDLVNKKDTTFTLGNGVNVANVQLDEVSRWFNVPQNLSLGYKNNNLTFNYVGATLKSPQKVKYQYQLEGLEDNWSGLTVSNEVTYGNLPWGSYTFKVKAMNGDGVWGNPLHYSFSIRPPWWRTWWAYVLYTVLVVGSAFYLYRFQLYQSLQKSEALRLKELDAAKTKLYTNITHEFRTPITVILGMAEQILEHPKEHFKEGLNMIVRNGRNLLLLVNQLLDLSKLESGKLNLHYQQADIVTYFKYIAESFHSLAENKGVQIHFLADIDELVMDFDETRLQQIASNLIANAIKFTPKGGHIYISTGTKDNRFILKIKDTGIGIAEVDLPHIFDRFYQSDGSHSRLVEGTGIGLALARELAKLMEGTIEVKSTKGKGAIFEVTLPIRHISDVKDTTQEVAFLEMDINIEESISNKGSSFSFLTKREDKNDNSTKETPLVLIADDNEDVRTYIASCIVKEYAIEIAKNGEECEAIAKDVIPDLIVLDVMMPFKDGFEVCKLLKADERTSHIPIIMLTAKADMDSRLEGLDRGADDYLTKPFHKKELLTRIANLLSLRLQLQKYYLSSLEQHLSAGMKSEQENDLTISNTASPKLELITDQGDDHKRSILHDINLENAFVIKAKNEIEMHLSEADFNVEKLCRLLALSNSQVHRKLSALTGLSATHFIRYVRLIKAKELMIDSRFKIAAIAIDCGFNDPAYFSRVFKKEFGLTPQKWRNQNSVLKD